MKYKLIAADVDGTLVNDKSVFTPRTLTAIRDAVDAGVIFAVATGRPLCAVKELLYGKQRPQRELVRAKRRLLTRYSVGILAYRYPV